MTFFNYICDTRNPIGNIITALTHPLSWLNSIAFLQLKLEIGTHN